MQMMIEIPEELKAVGEAVEALVRQIETAWRPGGSLRRD